MKLGRYKPNDAEVASKVMDGEAILINLSNGTYYSMDKTASVIWSMISLRYNTDEIVNKVCEIYNVNKDDIKNDIEDLFNNLINEKIIVDSNDEKRIGDFNDAPENGEYEKPKLNIYNDMKDLLALDPPMPRLDDIPWQNNPKKEDK
jgi:Coenzyme PQQ synthesis protein D (PqqD)